MQQAIEEGFILDVLRNYTPYKTAFRLTHNGQTYETEDTAGSGTIQVSGGTGDELVDKRAAIKSVMNWVKLHPTNIAQKVQIVIEHYRENVGWRLDGKAKAMVVTSSEEGGGALQTGLRQVRRRPRATPMLRRWLHSPARLPTSTRSGECHRNLNEPGTQGPRPTRCLRHRRIQRAVGGQQVSDGFDQPLLVAMYVDKRLSGVAAVQTLSRLNRVAPGKDQTFVLDFANTAEDIVEAFEPYYEATTLADVTDPNIVHETMNKLDAAGIYQESEINGLVDDYLAHKGHEALNKWVTPARDRFRDRQRQAKEHSDQLALEELQLFRKDVGTFLRQYDFLSQIVNYEDISLEKLSIYLRHLAPVIAESQLDHEIDLSTVDFDYIAQHKQDTTSGKPSGGVRARTC